MSIWCSWAHIGTDPNEWTDLDGNRIEQVAERGNVVSYAEGFSNHHPDLSGSHERPAVVAVSTIAPWCVPGHDQNGERYACTGCGQYHDTEVGPWLRLEVAAPQTLNFWTKNEDGEPTTEERHATVALDREAVESLRNDLSTWLEADHVEVIA
jgi:hypothetical protein